MINTKQLQALHAFPRHTWWMVSLLLLAFVFNNVLFSRWVGGLLGHYLLPTLMWGLIILAVYWLPPARPAGRLRLQVFLRWLAVISALLGIVGIMLQGMIGGFGTSPYDHSVIGICLNILLVGTGLLAIEMCRFWMLNRHFFQRPVMGISLLAVFFTILSLPLNQVMNLNQRLALTEFVGATLFPELAENVLAGALAWLGGPIPALIYRGGLELFEYLSPVLPDASWAVQSLFGTLVPLLCLGLVWEFYGQEARLRRSPEQGSQLGWIATGTAIILILWFAMGVFSYSPRVIVSGSMRPSMDIGDMVVIKSMTGDQAQLGDVILFPQGNMKVVHRIIEVREEEGKRSFITKGDANGEADTDPVFEKAVQGKVVMVIPKVGYLTLLFRA